MCLLIYIDTVEEILSISTVDELHVYCWQVSPVVILQTDIHGEDSEGIHYK